MGTVVMLKGRAQTRGLRDPLRSLQWNPFAFEGEAALQLAPLEQVRRQLSALVQEREGRESHAKVGLVHGEILAVRGLVPTKRLQAK